MQTNLIEKRDVGCQTISLELIMRCVDRWSARELSFSIQIKCGSQTRSPDTFCAGIDWCDHRERVLLLECDTSHCGRTTCDNDAHSNRQPQYCLCGDQGYRASCQSLCDDQLF